MNTDEKLPGVSAKEAAEMVAAETIRKVLQDCKDQDQAPADDDDTVLLEDEQWTLASYMEGMSEQQDELDAKVCTALSHAFNTIHEGLDEIEQAHKIADGGIKKQREGLIKFKKIVDNTPLYNVGHLLEEFMGKQVTEEGGEHGEAKKSMAKVDIPEPSFQPIRVQAPAKGGKTAGQLKRHYRCPKSRCNFLRVNREAVNAHIWQKHDHTKIGLCTSCGQYYSHNKGAFLIHMQGCGGGVHRGTGGRTKLNTRDTRFVRFFTNK